eukprot:TRINITY_DN20026_c0_g1_i1.p1 TRINITY_DN20026_c0_g1~~TRINITY_DN20026_c0_g1_i1.p1  ORF type:complete len:140 (-),score=8.86 TRINITY_DN20026_c0_g1_i1:75-446(-)
MQSSGDSSRQLHVQPENPVITPAKLHELLAQIDPNEKLDTEVEELMTALAEDFIESVTTFACGLAKHRKSDTLEVKDLKLHLEREWNISIPGFPCDPAAVRRDTATDAHRQRLDSVMKDKERQ